MRRRLVHPHLFTMPLLLGVLLVPFAAQAEFAGKVVGVIDGDSIRMMHEGKAEQIASSGSTAQRSGNHSAHGRRHTRRSWPLGRMSQCTGTSAIVMEEGLPRFCYRMAGV